MKHKCVTGLIGIASHGNPDTSLRISDCVTVCVSGLSIQSLMLFNRDGSSAGVKLTGCHYNHMVCVFMS